MEVIWDAWYFVDVVCNVILNYQRYCISYEKTPEAASGERKIILEVILLTILAMEFGI